MTQETTLDAKLNDPTTRAVVQAYWSANIKELDENVYRPLEGRYPSLKGVVESMREDYDPISKLEEAKAQIGAIQPLKGLVGAIDGLLTAIDGKEDEDFKTAKAMFEKLDPVVDLFNDYFAIATNFYSASADAIQDIASEEGINSTDVVKNKSYMDEVMKRVFPTREEAQKYFDVNSQASGEMIELSRGLVAFAKKTGQANDEVLEAGKLLPTKKAYDHVLTASNEYQTQELDRIYAPKK